MFNIAFTLMLMYTINTSVIFDFSKSNNMEGWFIVNDGVMGGRSQSTFALNTEGNGLFKGEVSLENNGGFASVHYRFQPKDIKEAKKLVLTIKGDGKKYQARIYANVSDYYSYIAYFTSTGEWQTVEIPLADMYPSFRGRKLDKPNFSGKSIEEIAILIANNKAENFQLEISKIELK